MSPATAPTKRRTLTEYRRGNRVAICVGGEQYVQTLARSLSADQRADENTLAAQIDAVDLVVVPALVDSSGAVSDAGACWRSTTADEGDGTSTSSGPRMSLRSQGGAGLGDVSEAGARDGAVAGI